MYTPYVNRIFFPLCIYINVSQKKSFLDINVDNNDYHQKKRTCTVLYIQKTKKMRSVYICIYINPDTFQKARQFPLRFYLEKSRYFTLRDFREIFEIGIIYIQRALHVALRDVFI